MKKILFVLLIFTFATSMFAFNWTEKVYNEKNKAYNISIKYPYLTDNTASAKKINNDILQEINNAVKNYKEVFSDDDVINNQCEMNTIEYEITLNRPDIFSCYLHIYSYTGGVHPFASYHTFTYTIDGDIAKPIKINDLFKNSTEPVKKVILDAVNNEKIKREGIKIETIETASMETFTIDPFGVNFLFPAYELGCYAEGEYVICINWDNVKNYVFPNIISDYVLNTKARNNIAGTITLTDGKKFPLNTTCQMNLVWIPTNKPGKILESNTSKVIMNTNKIVFRNSYDWTDKDPKNEYEIQTKLFFDGVLAYEDSAVFTITEQGWPSSVEIPLIDVHSKDFLDKTFDNIGYIRIASKILSDKYGVLEFRFLDSNNKILRKQYLTKDNDPFFFDIAINSKELSDLHGLQIFLLDNSKVIGNTPIFPLTLQDWTLPAKIDIK